MSKSKSKSRAGIIGPIALVLLVIGWVLLLIPSLSSAQRNLSLATVTSGSREPAKFGIIDWEGGYFDTGRSAAFRTNSRNQVGYQAGLDMPIARPNPFNSSLPPDLSRMPYTVTSRNETEPLVMLPVSLGILALAIIFLGIGIGASKANSTWTGLALLFSFVGTILAWVGWGFAFNLASVIEGRISRYTRDPYAILSELNVNRGNAIWPGLVGAIFASIASILITVKLARRPRHDLAEQMEMSKNKPTEARQGPASSDSTLA